VKVLFPGCDWSSKAPPLSAVTVCACESRFFTVILAPGATEAGSVYLKSLIVMTSPDEPPEPDAEFDEPPPDEPQAVVARTTAKAQDITARRVRRLGVVAWA
jgi:hypothetical protein